MSFSVRPITINITDATRGRFLHLERVLDFLGSTGPMFDVAKSPEAIAAYLRADSPGLVPRRPGGGAPTDLELAQIFWVHYYLRVTFRSRYLVWLGGRRGLPVGDLPRPVTSVGRRDKMELAWSGDIAHRNLVHDWVGYIGPSLDLFVSAASQAQWLKEHHPALVPPKNPNGTPPNDHTVSSEFEYLYATWAQVRRDYIRWLLSQPRPPPLLD